MRCHTFISSQSSHVAAVFVFLALPLVYCPNRAAGQTNGNITLPPATIGTGYAVQISMDGFEVASPYTIDVNGLPGSLTFDASSKVISGKPDDSNKAQTYALSIVIKDANAKTTNLSAKLILNSANTSSAAAGEEIELPDAIQGQLYKSQVIVPSGATAGTPNPALPNGLAVDSSGAISGEPTGNGIEGEYHSTLALSGGSATNSLKIRLKLYLSAPVLKLYRPCYPDAPPTITTTLSDVSTTISGSASVPSGCSSVIAVWAVDPGVSAKRRLDYLGPQPTPSDLQSAHGNAVQIKSGSTVAADGTFSVQLSNPPIAGQTIVLEERLTDSSQNLAGSIFSKPIPVHFAGDWGRVKTYFTSGILLSEDQGSFSQSSLFLSFVLNKSWMLPRPVYAQSHWAPGFDTFFETRLTSVPVTAQPCPSANSTTSGQCTNQNGSDVFNTFLTSQKAARVLVGAYLPFITKVWTYNGVRNGLFLAPLAKIGFDTPVASIDQSQAQSQSSNSGNTPGTVIVPVNSSNFYNFYVYGARIGHEALPAPEKQRDSDNWAVNEAPEINSYIDVAVGRFSNLQTVLNNGVHTRLYRFYLEGVLKVPSTPLVLGFNANIGQANMGVNSANIRQRAADDLRFLIGAKFDVGKITNYLTSHAF